MKDIFALIGLTITVAVIFTFIGMFIIFVIDKIEIVIRKYKHRNRFGKPLISNCHCKDCTYYNKNGIFNFEDVGACEWFNITVCDNYFCCKAKLKE